MKNKQTNVGSFATAKLQAKKRSFLVIALVAVIGFSMIACGGGGDGDGGGGGGGGGGGSKLTITGLPIETYGTYAVWVFTSGADISTFKKFNAAIAAGHLEATGVSLSKNNVFDYLVIKNTADPYKGSGSKEVYLQQGSQDRYATSVSFSSGSATVPFSSFTLAVMD